MKHGVVKDNHLDYIIRRVFLPAQAAINQQNVNLASSGTVTTLTSAANNNRPFVEINASGVVGAQFTSTSDAVCYLWTLPADFDNRHRLFVRHWWCTDNAASVDTVAATFNTHYTTVSIGQRLYEPATSAGLYTDNLSAQCPGFAAASAGVSSIAVATGWGYIAKDDAGTFAYQTFHPNVQHLTITARVSTASGQRGIAAASIYYLGLELGYTPSQTFGDGSGREARQLQRKLDHQMEAGPDVVR